MKNATRHFRILAVTVFILLICAVTCLVSNAETVSGTFNHNTWTLDTATGVFTISGIHDVAVCEVPEDYPWHFYRSEIKSVKMNLSANVVPSHAFYGCENLTSVTLSSNVTVIEEGAFGECTSLTSISLPNITTILNGAFANCTSLSTISLPSSLVRIGEYAFANCTKLSSITVPASVTTIKRSAFEGCTSLTSATIKSTELQLGSAAFAKCTKLSSISIPSNIISLGYDVFDGCTSLSFTQSDNAYYLGNQSNPYAVLIKATSTDITSCTVNSNTKMIAHKAFANCQKLASVTIGSNVTAIGNEAFSNCTALSAISLPKSVSKIGSNAFSGCTKLAQISVNQSNTTYHSSGNCLIETATKTLIVGCKASSIPTNGSVSVIGFGAFSNCDGLTSITIPASVVSINGRAFEDCDGLTAVTIPQTVRTVGTQAFAGCDALLSVTLSTEGTIAQEAFLNCKNLEVVNFTRCPSSFYEKSFHGCDSLSKINVTDVGSWCDASFVTFSSNPLFYGKKLYVNNTLATDLVIPEGTVTVADNAFFGCESISSVSLPQSLEGIGAKAFSRCDNLFSATLPKSVASVGLWAFEDCSSLASVTLLSETTQIATADTTFPYSTVLFGFNGSTTETFANRYGKHTFLSIAVDRVSVFELKATFTPDASKAGTLIPLITITRTLWGQPVVYEPLYVDGATGELFVLNESGTAEAAYYFNGDRITLGSEATDVTVVYDNESGHVRFYMNQLLPYSKDHTALSDFAVPVAKFITIKASKDVVSTADGVSLVDAYGLKESASADFIGFQVNVNDSSSLRVLAGIDMLYYDSVGFEISMYVNSDLQGTVTTTTQEVFTGLMANGSTISANALGYRYLAALSIEGIDRTDYSPEQTVYFTVKPFATVGSDRIYGNERRVFINYNEDTKRHEYATNTAGTHVVSSLGDIEKLTFSDNLPQVICEICDQSLPSGYVSRLDLSFDKATLTEEIAALANSQNRLSTFETNTSYPNTILTVDGRTVLHLPHNSSSMVLFDASLLADSSYYAVSFDWRATELGGSSVNQGVFALATLDATNTAVETSFVAMMNRVSGEFSAATGGTTHATITAIPNTWYHFNVVVNNRTGAAAVYVDGVLLATYNDGFSVSSLAQGNGTFAWRFGGQYNVYHKPQFDNFSVVKLTPDCAHSSASFVVTTEATCINEGVRTRICSGCGEVLASETIPVTDHSLTNVSDLGCLIRGTCSVCQVEQTRTKNFGTHSVSFGTDFSGVSLVNGQLYGSCSVCGKSELVSIATNRLSLDFDQTSLAAEIAAITTTQNGLSTFETFTTSPNKTVTSGDRTVLSIPHNSSSMVLFNPTLLSDTPFYTVSFDWRPTVLSGTETKQGVFALSRLDSGKAETSASFVAMITRSTGVFSVATGGTAHASITATANTWYHFTLIVDNRTGAAAVYIDDMLFATYQSGFAISATDAANGSYAWRFGGQFNLYHQPEFDNFCVSAQALPCPHNDYETIVVKSPTCTESGLETYECNLCGETVGTKVMEPSAHIIPNGVDFGCIVRGICTECKTEQTRLKTDGKHTIVLNKDFSGLTFAGGKFYGACESCGNPRVPMEPFDILALDFDKSSLATEIAEISTSQNGLSTFETYTSSPNKIKVYDDRTVLHLPHNSSSMVPFNASLLSEKEFYAISFDWRATALDGTASTQGVFALSVLDPSNTEVSSSFIATMNRQTGVFFAASGGTQLATITATANTWYQFTVVVNNKTGAAAIYIDDVLFATYETGFKITQQNPEDGTYAWRFGGQFNIYHKPEFDNFRIVKLIAGCTHATSHFVTVKSPSCTEEGVSHEICDVCEIVLSSSSIAKVDHVMTQTTDLGCAIRVSCMNCDKATTTVKENAVHSVSEFGNLANLTIVNGKIFGTCLSCGQKAVCTEDVRLALDFDRESFIAETNEKNLSILRQSPEGTVKDDCFDVVSYPEENRTVLRNLKSGRLYLNFSASDYSDAEIYTVSFDWRFTTSASGQAISIFATCNGTANADGTTSISTYGNIIRFDRNENALTDGTDLLMYLTEDQWYTFTIVYDNLSGTAYLYVDGTLVKTVTHQNFKMTDGKNYCFRLGEGWSTHYPEYDNFRISVIK